MLDCFAVKLTDVTCIALMSCISHWLSTAPARKRLVVSL